MRLKIIIIILLLFPSLAWGACGGTTIVSGDTYTAYDVSYDCVALAVSDAEAGGYGKTVQIPAGTGTWNTWTLENGTSGVWYMLKITKDMRIVGAGVASTFIDITATTPTGDEYGAAIMFSPDATAIENIKDLNDTGIFEITGITFTGTNARHVSVFNVDKSLASVVKRIRFHNNKVILVTHILEDDWGYSHGLVDNNYLWNSTLYYAAATTYSISNLIHPGSGGGWYFEDNITEVSSPYVRMATNTTGVKFNAFDYYIGHTKYSKSATDNVALPTGTVPSGTYGIYRFSIAPDGTFTITPGSANFTTGYASAALAIAAVPAVPEGDANMGYGYLMKSDGDFVNGTTALNAANVTNTVGSYDWPGEHGLGGGNNDGTGAVIRYNKISGIGGATQEYIDVHSNQLGIMGGQVLEVYGNNMLATNSAGTVNRGIYIRGQKNIYLYNVQAGTAAKNVNAINIVEEWNDYYSIDTTPEFDDAEKAALDALYMCTARTTYDGDKQVCPGYYIALPDRTATRCGCWKVHDSYFVNNRYAVGGDIWVITHGVWDRFRHEDPTVNNDPPEVVENVEWFDYVAVGSFNGSAGVTCGTTAQMNAITPATTGVGFWVPTNIDTMPCTEVLANNIKQTEGVAPVTPITGTLYKWDGDSWEAFWIPYQYPHPLRGSGGTATIGAGGTMGLGAGGTIQLQ